MRLYARPPHSRLFQDVIYDPANDLLRRITTLWDKGNQSSMMQCLEKNKKNNIVVLHDEKSEATGPVSHSLVELCEEKVTT